MICKRCGRDIVGTNKCLYCGKVLDVAENKDNCGKAVKGISLNDLTVNEHKNENESNANSNIGGSYSDGDYVDYSYTDFEDNSPENFFHRYQEGATLERGKKIVNLLKRAVSIIGLVTLVGFIIVLIVDADVIPNLFGFDVHNGTDEEMFAFIHKLLLIMVLFILIPLTMTCIQDILDWLSMQSFSKEIKSKNINGISLLTKARLSDKNGKKEYIFISNSLCMADEPSQKIIVGVKVVVKTMLNITLFVVVINFISYLTLTLMPSVAESADLRRMMYTDNEFWLEPNILLLPIMFWANIIINSIISIIANRKYTRWVKNNNK